MINYQEQFIVVSKENAKYTTYILIVKTDRILLYCWQCYTYIHIKTEGERELERVREMDRKIFSHLKFKYTSRFKCIPARDGLPFKLFMNSDVVWFKA